MDASVTFIQQLLPANAWFVDGPLFWFVRLEDNPVIGDESEGKDKSTVLMLTLLMYMILISVFGLKVNPHTFLPIRSRLTSCTVDHFHARPADVY